MTTLYDINSYTKLSADCYQNLLITLLDYYKFDVAKLGAIWPWNFELKNHNIERPIISNHKIVTPEIAQSVFGAKVAIDRFGCKNTIMDELSEVLQKVPFIVNIDEYNVPHHYKHIYKTQHGMHSLLLIGKEEEQFICVDTMPVYKGPINQDDLVEGIKHFPLRMSNMKYCWLDIENRCDELEIPQIYDNFTMMLKSIKNERNMIQKDYSTIEKLSLKDILHIINEKKNELCDDDFFIWMKLFFGDTWLWEINRYPSWLSSFLKIEYVKERFGAQKVNIITEKISEINTLVVLSFRYYVKSVMKGNICDQEIGDAKIRQAIEIEDEILDLLLENMK